MGSPSLRCSAFKRRGGGGGSFCRVVCLPLMFIFLAVCCCSCSRIFSTSPSTTGAPVTSDPWCSPHSWLWTRRSQPLQESAEPPFIIVVIKNASFCRVFSKEAESRGGPLAPIGSLEFRFIPEKIRPIYMFSVGSFLDGHAKYIQSVWETFHLVCQAAEACL